MSKSIEVKRVDASDGKSALPQSMFAITFQGKEKVELKEIPTPQIEVSTDAIVKVLVAGLCGSDLHPYHEREKGLDHGTVMGHEFVGEVVAIGSDVKELKIGVLVCCPFSTNCGKCFYCLKRLSCRCVNGQLFGWRSKDKGLHGGQAQFIRVPLADGSLHPIPQGVSLEEALLSGDILATGYFCALNAEVPRLLREAKARSEQSVDEEVERKIKKPKISEDSNNNGDDGDNIPNDSEPLLVVGCGPVGLMTIISAKHMGARHIIAVDSIPQRLDMASKLGAWRTVNLSTEDAVTVIKRLSNGRGVAAAMEAVGGDSAVRLAYDCIRHGGIISSVGVNTSPHFPFSPDDAYNKNITYKIGRCPAGQLMKDVILPALQSRALAAATTILTHRVALQFGQGAYTMFDKKQDGCIKLVFYPWGIPK